MKKYYYAKHEHAENYYDIGEFSDDATKADAAKKYFEDNPEENVVWIAHGEPPTSPDHAFDAYDFVERVMGMEDYSIECAEFYIPEELEDQFEQVVRNAIEGFLTLHHLMPTFFICRDAEKFTRQ